MILLFAATALLVAGHTVQAEDDRQGVPDPLLFSTFVGGGDADWPHATVVAPNGTVYVTGYTLSFDFPTTEGAYQRVTKGNEEVYVLHLSADGSELLWATLIGGSGQDIAWDLAVGTDGRVYVTGMTRSANFPTTQGAYLRTREGGSDAFVVCLAADGGSLVYSTLLGGEDDDKGYAIKALSEGRVLVAGNTGSMFFPTTNGAYDRTLGGVEDVFVVRLSPDGKALEAATYLGGSYTEMEPSIALGGSGGVWVTGSTTSQDFPTTAGLPNDWSFARDVFITALDSDLTHLSRSTVVGQIGSDVPRSIDIGPGGEVLVAGYTHSPEFPDTGPEPGNDNSGNWDAFILVYKSTLLSRDHQWLYGGNNYDVARAARYDQKGLIHVVGYTNSTNFPTTLGSYQPYKTGDDHDIFYIQVDPDAGYTTINSTYIGKSMGDFGMDMALDQWDIPVIVGHSRSPGFPMEGDPYDDTHDGGGDIVVLKYTTDEAPPVFSNDITPGRVETGANLTFSVDVDDQTTIHEVWLHYTVDQHDFQRPYSVLMEGDGTYSVNITIYSTSLGLHYNFMAWDVLGHFSVTEEREVTVIDTYPPELYMDETAEKGTTGDPFEFRFQGFDNWAIKYAKVEYVIEERMANSSMSTIGSDHGYTNWNLTIELAGDSLDPVRYRFHLQDGSDNQASTHWVEVEVTDDDPPTIGEMDLPDRVPPGTWVTIDVPVSDNIGVLVVWLEYFVELDQVETVPIEAPYGPRVTVDVPVPTGRGDLHITLRVGDAAGNIANATGFVPFLDGTPPKLTAIYENTTTTGDVFTLTWSASDPAGIHSMWGFHVFGHDRPLEEYTYFLADEIPTSGVEIPVPGDSTDPLNIILFAKDTYGNENNTGLIIIPVEDNDPPIAIAGEDMVVKPSDTLRLDASGSSDNVGIHNYTWKWIVPKQGNWVITTTTEPWIEVNLTVVGDYHILLEVTDIAGNTATDFVDVAVVKKAEQEDDSVVNLTFIVFMIVALIGLGLFFDRHYKKQRA